MSSVAIGKAGAAGAKRRSWPAVSSNRRWPPIPAASSARSDFPTGHRSGWLGRRRACLPQPTDAQFVAEEAQQVEEFPAVDAVAGQHVVQLVDHQHAHADLAQQCQSQLLHFRQPWAWAAARPSRRAARRRSGSRTARTASARPTPGCARSASELAGWVRRNFSTIIDLPLLVGPTSSRLGMRCLFGHA